MVVAGLAQHGDYGKWRRAARAVRGGVDALAPRTELRHLRPGYSTYLGKLFHGKGYHTRRLPRCDFSTETFNYRNCFKNSLGCAIYMSR